VDKSEYRELARRSEIARHLRELGENTRGPAPLTKQDRSRFLSALDTALQAASREARGR
jgi:hypothetical protein